MIQEKPRVAGVILKDKKILLLHRWKNGQEYYVLPGGRQEQGETPEETIIREIKEELNLEVKSIKKLFEFTHLGHREYYYLIKEFTGKLKAIGDSERSSKIKDEVIWCSFKKLEELNLMPPKAKKQLLILALDNCMF